MATDKTPSIAQWISHAIAECGCNTVYGGHGGALVPIVNAVVNHPSLLWVYGRNEHNAATMAAAHAKLTGKLGCVIATSGPGATNLVTGLLEAELDRVPLLAITGMKPRAQVGYAEFQDLYQDRLFAGAGITWSKVAQSPDSVIPLLRDAVSYAMTHQVCVHLAIPVDVQASPSPLPLKHFCASFANVRVSPARVNEELLEAAAATIAGKPTEPRPRVLIAVGLDACWAGTGDEVSEAIMDFAVTVKAPVVTRLDAKGVVNELHALALGVVGVHGQPGLEAATTLIGSADIIIDVGMTEETLLLCDSAGLQVRRLIEIKPSAFVVSTRFSAEHTLVGNVISTIKCLTKILETKMAETIITRRESLNEANVLKVKDLRASRLTYFTFDSDKLGAKFTDMALEDDNMFWEAIHDDQYEKLTRLNQKNRYEVKVTPSPQYCHPSTILKHISYAVQKIPNATVAVDVGDVTLWSALCLSLPAGTRTLYSERLGTMGYALCAGVAAILARRKDNDDGGNVAFVVAGDAGFQMTLQELATFQQHKNPGDKLIVVVLDNEIMGRVKFGRLGNLGCDLPGPDYLALAKAYGGDGVRVNSCAEAQSAVETAVASEGLFMLHVIVDPEVSAHCATYKDNAAPVVN